MVISSICNYLSESVNKLNIGVLDVHLACGVVVDVGHRSHCQGMEFEYLYGTADIRQTLQLREMCSLLSQERYNLHG